MDLRGKLKHGDMKLIAEMSGVSYSTARSILIGRRATRYGGEKVKAVAAAFLASRQQLEQKINQQLA